MVIPRAGPSDIEGALALISSAFSLSLQAPTVHTMVAGLPGGCLLVAESDGVIVGTGGAVSFGRTGWIGGITVAPAARGRGLGRALTEASLACLDGCETVLLLASALGRPIYDRLGFVSEGDYRVFMAGEAPVRSARVFSSVPREVVLALDARV